MKIGDDDTPPPPPRLRGSCLFLVFAAVAAFVSFGVSAVVNGVCVVFAVKPVLGLD